MKTRFKHRSNELVIIWRFVDLGLYASELIPKLVSLLTRKTN